MHPYDYDNYALRSSDQQNVMNVPQAVTAIAHLNSKKSIASSTFCYFPALEPIDVILVSS